LNKTPIAFSVTAGGKTVKSMAEATAPTADPAVKPEPAKGPMSHLPAPDIFADRKPEPFATPRAKSVAAPAKSVRVLSPKPQPQAPQLQEAPAANRAQNRSRAAQMRGALRHAAQRAQAVMPDAKSGASRVLHRARKSVTSAQSAALEATPQIAPRPQEPRAQSAPVSIATPMTSAAKRPVLKIASPKPQGAAPKAVSPARPPAPPVAKPSAAIVHLGAAVDAVRAANALPDMVARFVPGVGKSPAKTPVAALEDASHPVDAPRMTPDQIRTRAEMASVYAGLLGADTPAGDLRDVLTTARENDPLRALARSLQSADLVAEIASTATITPDLWPAMAAMTNGQIVLVLRQRGGELIVYDATCTDKRAHVDLSEFKEFFSGTLLHAEAPLEHLSRAHSPKENSGHWFWSQFGRFRRYFVEIALGSLIANMLAVAVALFSLQVYDRVIPHQSEATLWVLAAGAGIALLLEACMKIARARLMDGAGRQIELSVQSILMDRILGMRSAAAGKSPASLFSSMREFGSVREFFTASTIGTLADIPFIFVFLALVASIAGPVVWVLIAGGILMVLPGVFLQKKMIRLTHETQGASAKSSRLLHEAIFELDTVKTQRGEDRFRRLWAELTTLSAVKSSDQRKIAAALSFWSQGVQQATYVSAVIFGTYLVFAGQFTVGSIIAVGILTGRTLGPLTQLSGTMARWGNVKAALDGLDAIAHSEQDEEEARSYLRREALRGQYELRKVMFRYDEDGGVDLDVPQLKISSGEHLAILGANGSGKSTLLKLMSGLYEPSEGRILLDGTGMNQIAPRDLRRGIGYLGQDVRLFSGTLRENLNLTMMERDDDRLMEALDFAGLGPFVKAHHKGLDLVIRDGGEGLSVGQRQSIGWARLWLQDPKVCLLDEPTAALDQTLENTLVSRLEDWLEGRTAIIATHRVPILKLTERTLIMQGGRLTVDGPRDDVLAHLGRKPKAKGA